MAYVISDECVACGTCAGECPVEAISEGLISDYLWFNILYDYIKLC